MSSFEDDKDALNRKLDAIVGAFVRALIESGMDDAIIGALAASHRAKVADILGVEELPPAGPPDLLALVRTAIRGELAGARLRPPVRMLASRKPSRRRAVPIMSRR